MSYQQQLPLLQGIYSKLRRHLIREIVLVNFILSGHFNQDSIFDLLYKIGLAISLNCTANRYAWANKSTIQQSIWNSMGFLFQELTHRFMAVLSGINNITNHSFIPVRCLLEIVRWIENTELVSSKNGISNSSILTLTMTCKMSLLMIPLSVRPYPWPLQQCLYHL